MNVLLVTDRIPFPLTNGQNLRIYHFVRTLGRRHKFTLFSYGGGSAPEEIRSLFESIISPGEKPPPKPAGSFLRRIARSTAPDDMFVRDPRVERELDRVLAEGAFDLVWVSGWDMTIYLDRLRKLPVLADVVDDGVLEYWRAVRRSRKPLEWLRNLKRLFQNYRFERKYFRKAHVCNVVSEVDAAVLRRLCPGVPVSVVHNGVDTDYFQPLGSEEEAGVLVFEGSMKFAPNVDAAVYFVRKILPRIQKEEPQAVFYAVGKDPAPEVRALARQGVVVTGYVEDVRPYLDRAQVFVCPLRKGAGIKNKILQAWAMQKAVVATPESCGGLQVEHEKNAVIAAGVESFARAVTSLLKDPERRAALGREGRRTVIESYDWGAVAGALEGVFETTLERAAKLRQEACATISS